MLIRDITEQIFRRGNRLYYSSQHADQNREYRRVDDTKFEKAITNLENNPGWMRILDQAPDSYQGLPVYDPKSNLTLVMIKKPGWNMDKGNPQAYNIKTVWHGSNKSCNTPKLAKKNKFFHSDKTQFSTNVDFYHLETGYQRMS